MLPALVHMHCVHLQIVCLIAIIFVYDFSFHTGGEVVCWVNVSKVPSRFYVTNVCMFFLHSVNLWHIDKWEETLWDINQLLHSGWFGRFPERKEDYLHRQLWYCKASEATT